MRFRYKASNPAGEVVDGTLEAVEEAQAVDRLFGQGLTPFEVRPVRERAAATALPALPGLRRRLRAGERLAFTEQMETLLGAGLPLDRALALAAQSASRASVATRIDAVREAVLGGTPLSDALEADGGFSRLYISIVRTGEGSGDLAVSFARLSQFLNESAELRSSVATAMIYPALLTLVSGGAVTFLLLYVVPKFESMLREIGQALPLSTQLLLAATDFLLAWGWLVLLTLVVAFIAFRLIVARPGPGMRWDRFLLGVPLLGPLIVRIEVTRLSRTLATLLSGGVGLLAALRMAGDVIGNRAVRAALADAGEGVKEGMRVTDPLRESGVVPTVALNMIAIGEETGRLEEMLERVGIAYEAEVRKAVRRLVALLEPAVILFMGLVVGYIVLSVLMAILSVNRVVG